MPETAVIMPNREPALGAERRVLKERCAFQGKHSGLKCHGFKVREGTLVLSTIGV